MRADEVKNKSAKELKQILAEKRERLRELRFLLSQGKAKNVREVRKMKKNIARILTVVNKNLKN